MPNSASEAFLSQLADRTFLALWAVSNPYHAPGRELTDLIVPFGDDIVIISDKASRFDVTIAPELAWQRWYKRAIGESLRQLKTAKQRLERQPDRVFVDGAARDPLAHALGAGGPKRFHLVAVARPDLDPAVVPAGWPGLRHIAPQTAEPFQIGPLTIGNHYVHVFDGPTIDLLLSNLDTAPDFIAYLTGRARRLTASADYDFAERDLLAAAMIGWEDAPTGLPSVPPLETIVDGIWDDFVARDTPARRAERDRPSRLIDQIIQQHHAGYAAGRMVYGQPTFAQHEQALRLLASESRFARRMIAHELHDILGEPDQSTYWASTLSSPTRPKLRYVWLIRPDAPDDVPRETADQVWQELLMRHVFVAQALFAETLVMGISIPNRAARDTAIMIVLHDGATWTDDDRRMALSFRDDGIFADLEEVQRMHYR